MFTNKKKGFTIIELLVVVAIIAVLAAIVLVNVTSYITKGKDAAARGNLATAQINGAVYYDTTTLGNGDYDGWITAANGATGAATWTPIYNALSSAGYAGTLVTSCDGAANCAGPNTTKWCAAISLKGSTLEYCVDSSGNKLEKEGAACTLGVCS